MADQVEMTCCAGCHFCSAKHKRVAVWAEGDAGLCRVQAQLAYGNLVHGQVEGAEDRYREGLLDSWKLCMRVLLCEHAYGDGRGVLEELC